MNNMDHVLAAEQMYQGIPVFCDHSLVVMHGVPQAVLLLPLAAHAVPHIPAGEPVDLVPVIGRGVGHNGDQAGQGAAALLDAPAAAEVRL